MKLCRKPENEVNIDFLWDKKFIWLQSLSGFLSFDPTTTLGTTTITVISMQADKIYFDFHDFESTMFFVNKKK